MGEIIETDISTWKCSSTGQRKKDGRTVSHTGASVEDTEQFNLNRVT